GSSAGSTTRICEKDTKDTKDTKASEEERQSVLHDQRGGAEVQHPPADAAPVRARGTAQAVAHGRKHSLVLGRGPRTARNDFVTYPRPWRQPGRRRDHSQHAAEDRA